MRHWTGSPLVQIMACRILSIGPLVTNLSEILIKIQNFSFTKVHLKISSVKWRPFCPVGGMCFNPRRWIYFRKDKMTFFIFYNFLTLIWYSACKWNPSLWKAGAILFCIVNTIRLVAWRHKEPSYPLQWHHNERDCVSNHQPRDYLRNRLFRHRSKKTSNLRVTGLCEENSPVTGEFPAQRASNAENVSIWWRHHEECMTPRCRWSTAM